MSVRRQQAPRQSSPEGGQSEAPDAVALPVL